SFAMGRLFSHAPVLRAISMLVYVSLTFGVVFLFANLRCPARVRWLLLANFALIGIAGKFGYSAVPALGPIYQFPGLYPWRPPALAGLTIEPLSMPYGFRNAMPSLHA